MRKIIIKNSYKKDYKKALKNPRQDTNKLNDTIELLAELGILPDEYKPHALIGNWKPSYECHIQPDFLLIYQVDDEILELYRCGSHSELFS